MENTCHFKDCVIAKKLKIKDAEECPNHIVSRFVPIDDKGREGQPVLIEDCVNIRLSIMVQDLCNDIVALRKEVTELRNQNIGTNNIARDLLNSAKKAIQHQLKEDNNE